MPSTIVILGAGGTIAGAAAKADDNVRYVAGQRSVADLAAGVAAAPGETIETEQVAQLDSKDMDHATWQRLALRAAHHLAREEVDGVVVTHGTDTLEETAWFLHRVLAPVKPLVLTAAMRPATSIAADGPQNLRDALVVARRLDAAGVAVVVGGTVYGAADVRKVHPYRIDAFGAGDAGPIAHVEEGRLRRHRAWPQGAALGLSRIGSDPGHWPWVEVIASHAGADGATVRALVVHGVRGIVVAGTGNGTVHRALEEALKEAEASGVPVWRCTRCPTGVVVGGVADASPAAALTPWQARIELMLELLGKR
jgi:L-asparaginase